MTQNTVDQTRCLLVETKGQTMPEILGLAPDWLPDE